MYIPFGVAELSLQKYFRRKDRGPAPLEALPTEILLHGIFYHLNIVDIFRLRRVSFSLKL